MNTQDYSMHAIPGHVCACCCPFAALRIPWLQRVIWLSDYRIMYRWPTERPVMIVVGW
jgi:hypothetical protein